MDTKSSMIPAARSYSHKQFDWQGRDKSSAASQKDDMNQSSQKSIKMQEKELKRIMQS